MQVGLSILSCKEVSIGLGAGSQGQVVELPRGTTASTTTKQTTKTKHTRREQLHHLDHKHTSSAVGAKQLRFTNTYDPLEQWTPCG